MCWLAIWESPKRKWIKNSKCYQIGPPTNGEQSIIVKFKSQNFRSRVYEQRKDIKNEKTKVKLSLTKKRTIILNYALGTNSDKSNFAFPDANGNLKIRITELVNHKSFFSFKDRQTTCSNFWIQLESS